MSGENASAKSPTSAAAEVAAITSPERKPGRTRRTRGAAPTVPEKESGPPVRVKLIRGQYVGLGCPDPSDRLYDEDLGFGYTHDHPARAHFVEVKGQFDTETQQMTPTQDVYEEGEVIQLWPIPEWEEKLEAPSEDGKTVYRVVDQMRAKDKRHSFSRREALRRAAEMVKQKIAQVVS